MQASVRQGSSVKMQRTRTEGSTTRLRSSSNVSQGSKLSSDDEGEQVVHSVEPRARTAMLPPVMVSQVTMHVGPRLSDFAAGEKGRLASAVLVGVRGRLHHDIVQQR